MSAVTGGCHCGAVTVTLAEAPTEITECNCSLCRAYGVRWIYCDASTMTLDPVEPATDAYAWNGRHVDFHRCATCGCVTHWVPRTRGRAQRGVNARLFDSSVTDAARLRHKDGAGTGKYLD